MNNLEFLQLYLSAEKSLNQATLIEAKQVKITHASIERQVENMPWGVTILALVCFMIVWAIVVFIVSKGCKVARQDRIVTINRLQQIPCKTCRFFNNNHYLKCAVHPSIALTGQALNCFDYWPQYNRKSNL